jgi:preprotein translocase subunit SecB
VALADSRKKSSGTLMSDSKYDHGNVPTDGPQIGLQKIYLKDSSFEAPNSPGIFSGEWKPAVTINLSTKTNDLGNESIEVILELSVEARQGESLAFLVEVQQAGIFLLKGFSEQDRSQVLKTFCPTQLYPYAREAVADMVGKGGFPQMHLQPVSFEAMLAAAEAERGARKTSAEASESPSA